MRRFERFATTADVGLRIRGRDLSEFYANAICGFSFLLFGALISRDADEQTPFDYRGDGPENVLVNLLSAALELTWSGRAPTGLEVERAGERHLRGQLRHRPWKTPPRMEIKSITYHDLHVEFRNGFWRAAVVFDI
jgi:SHS2 domain-containing protein